MTNSNLSFQFDFINSKKIKLVPRSFNEFKHCFVSQQIDKENDIFQLESTSSDGVCITSLKIDGRQVLVGKNKDMQNFWIDSNDNNCLDNFTGTTQLTIQNGLGNVRLEKFTREEILFYHLTIEL